MINKGAEHGRQNMNSFEEQIKNQFAEATGKKFVELVDAEVEEQVNLIKKNMIEYISHMEHRVKACHRTKLFDNLYVLEMENKIGFIDEDIRPGHAVWMPKEDAIRIYRIFESMAFNQKRQTR
jgi:hypothetical protein